jgi:hypothetical protein
MVVFSMRMAVRTGRVVGHSTARLAMMAAAVLAQHHTTPEVARELVQFFGQWHRLIEVGQEVAK